jgi:hypothetical protein
MNSQQNYNLDKFNSMIDQATQAISCGPDCQNQQTSEQLKQTYLNAQTNLATAPNNVYVSRKNYIVYDEGQPAYDELINTELSQQAQSLSSYYQTSFNSECQNINFNIDTYSGLLINLKNVSDLYFKYKMDNTEMLKQLKDETNDILTNDRKTYYQDQGINNLNLYYHYFFLLIYIIVVLCYLVYNFMYTSQLSILVRGIIFVLMILLPFFSTWILEKIVSVIYYVYNWLPKNMHKQLQNKN